MDGRGISLRWQSDSVLDIGEEFHTWAKPAGCADLPVTGTSIGRLITAGLLMTILGLLLAYAARRRKTPNHTQQHQPPA